MASKVIISVEVLTIAYNKAFAKWSRAKGQKKEALGLELERLNDEIDKAQNIKQTKHK